MEVIPASRIMDAINGTDVVAIGDDDRHALGACVTADYIEISKILGMPPLQKAMTPVLFKALTELDHKALILRLVGKN